MTATSYCNRIRNVNKRNYAKAYLYSQLENQDGPDYRNYKISYMAAQGVRLTIDGILTAPRSTSLPPNPTEEREYENIQMDSAN